MDDNYDIIRNQIEIAFEEAIEEISKYSIVNNIDNNIDNNVIITNQNNFTEPIKEIDSLDLYPF